MSRAAALLLALGLAARLAYGLWAPPGGRGGPMPDPDGYAGLAARWAETGSLVDAEGRPSALREPGYPLLLGAVFKLTGPGYAGVLLLNTALGMAVLWMLWTLGGAWFGPAAGLVALGLGALYPPFLFHGTQPMRETALTAASLGVVYLACRAAERGSLGAWALAAAGCSAAALLNTTFLPFGLVVVPAGLLWLGRRAPRAAAARAALYLAVFCAVYAPWPLRNQARFGRFILGSTAGAASSFYIYLVVPQELGGLPEQTAITDADPVVSGARGLDPAATESYYWKAGLAKVAAEPWRFARLYAWRFCVDLWRVTPRPRPGTHPHGQRLLAAVSWLTDGWLLPAAAVGAWLVGAAPPLWPWALGLVASVHSVYALVLTGIRYRMSATPWVLLLAAVALERAWRRRGAGKAG